MRSIAGSSGHSGAPTLACLDVDYRADCVVAACLGFHDWTDDAPALETVERSRGAAAAYEPGQFWRREMPYLLGVLAQLERLPSTVVVDGYVWLDQGKPGLGAHLFHALEGRVAVIGVAKSRFRGADAAVPVLRGKSKEPLFVGAVGAGVDEAVRAIAQMAGPYRIPALLRRVNRLSRA